MIDTREWPAVNLVPLPGGGLFRGTYNRLKVPNPAAGADISITLPGGAWWMLLAMRWRGTFDANVGQRALSLRFGDGSTHFTFIPCTQIFAANQTWDFAASVGTPQLIQSTLSLDNVLMNLPALMLPPGYTISTKLQGVGAGDQFSAIETLFAEIDMGPRGEPIGLVNLPPQIATVNV